MKDRLDLLIEALLRIAKFAVKMLDKVAKGEQL